MLQYAGMVPTTIVTASGSVKKVIDFRKRIAYPYQGEFKIEEEDILRVDLLSSKVLGNSLNPGPIIDMNETDVLSLTVNDTILAGFNL